MRAGCSRHETFAAYIDRWLREHRPRIEEGTYLDYRSHVELRLKPFFGSMPLSDIAAADIRRYVAQLDEGLGAGALRPARNLSAGRVLAERLDQFTSLDLAEALGIDRPAAWHLVRRLEAEGSARRTGHFDSVASAGRRPRIYRWSGSPSQPLGDRGTAISAKTINNSLIPLRTALEHAVEDGLIAKNPAASERGRRTRIKVAPDHREMDYLRLAEIPRYLDACTEEYRPLAEVLIASGLRISEALELRWTDVDLDAAVFLVTSSRKRSRDGGEGSGSTKGDRPRSVEFGPRTAGLLRDLRARRSEHAEDLALAAVFEGLAGRALNRRAISGGDHRTALRDAGLRTTLRLHDLRHTAAASWLAAGLPLIYVQRQLGHRSITTTERTYGHLEESFLRGAAQRAEAAVWQERREPSPELFDTTP